MRREQLSDNSSVVKTPDLFTSNALNCPTETAQCPSYFIRHTSRRCCVSWHWCPYSSLVHQPTFAVLLLCNCKEYSDCTIIATQRWGLARETRCTQRHVLTWCLPVVTAWRRSTCRQQRGGCPHRSCSFCRTCEDGWSPSELSRSPEHPILGQTPARMEGRGGEERSSYQWLMTLTSTLDSKVLSVNVALHMQFLPYVHM